MAVLSAEALYESKIATEKGLLDIGRAHLLKEQEAANKLKIKNDLLFEIRNYKKKSMLVSSVAVVNKIENYLKIIKEEEEDLLKKITFLEEENECFKDEIDEHINEIESLENKIENYWEPRVLKLRNKCIEKNNTISNLKKCLKLMFIIFIAYTIWVNYYFSFLKIVIEFAYFLEQIWNIISIFSFYIFLPFSLFF